MATLLFSAAVTAVVALVVLLMVIQMAQQIKSEMSGLHPTQNTSSASKTKQVSLNPRLAAIRNWISTIFRGMVGGAYATTEQSRKVLQKTPELQQEHSSHPPVNNTNTIGGNHDTIRQRLELGVGRSSKPLGKVSI
jgi:hypothetical protein